jgi:hypothetical protein
MISGFLSGLLGFVCGGLGIALGVWLMTKAEEKK